MKKVLDFIKANTIALSCAAVALLALLAYFAYPIPSLFGELQTEVDARKPIHASLKSLDDAARTLPQVDLGSTEAAPLTMFPTDRVIKVGEEALQRLSDQAGGVLQSLIKANQRQLLVPGSLPNPQTLARQNFLEAYKSVTQQYGEGAAKGLIATKLKGSLPPTETELREIESTVVSQFIKNNLQIDGSGKPVNQEQVDREIIEIRSKLPLEQRVIRAKSSQIYVSPGAVDIMQELLQLTNPPDPVLVFNGQFSLWVQSAVFEAIASANGNSENVLSSPIKHLVRLDMNMAYVPLGSGNNVTFNMGAPAEGEAALPELKPDAATPILLRYTSNPLGYSNNSMFDPIPVNLTLRIDSRRLPEVLAALQGGQLLKIEVLDHVVMGHADEPNGKGYQSLRELGYFYS